MNRKYNVFLASDSTGETLDRIFLALKAQFENFNNNLHHFSFVRTEAQITTLLEKCNKLENPIVLYTLVESAVTDFLIFWKVPSCLSHKPNKTIFFFI